MRLAFAGTLYVMSGGPRARREPDAGVRSAGRSL